MDKILARGFLVAICISILYFGPTQSQGTDLTVLPQSYGTAVVEATVQKINRLAEVNSDLRADNRFMRRVAWVETQDGTASFTYSGSYNGGIWRVDLSVYEATLAMYNNPQHSSIFDDIQQLFDINWISMTEWQDCRKPLYSALAARLYFHDILSIIPQGLNNQAMFWWNRYHDQPSDTVENFVTKVEDLESEGCSVVGIDLVFVLDSSGSVGSSNFEKTKNFVLNVVDSFDISTDETHVGVITYSSPVRVEFNLNAYTDKVLLKQAIGNIGYIGGGTNTVDALDTMESTSFLVENGGRPDSRGILRVAVVITDGQSQGAAAVAVPSDRAREKGITIFAIGVTANVNDAELNAIANKPKDTYVFHVDNFDAISNIAASIEYKSCNEPTPIQVPELNNTIRLGESQYLQQTVTEDGITLSIEAPEGNVVMYVSTTTPNPNEALHDYRLEAMEGEGRVEVFVGPEAFMNPGNFSVESSGGARRRRQVPSQNDTETASPPIGTVYMTIEGLQATNDFVLRVTEGDVTEPVTTQPPSSGCGFVAATMADASMLNVAFAVILVNIGLF